ncbi:hypothetical protein BDW42DRAFT_191368 [Aspergillus taichungensis]|uniref:DUF7136 domain-containing protein n=1 Tax=Aspergillus taichungensis TaxID=482145 RepID=A0A2J5I4D1_9EURO|nr:hypothetical protein BDW42DRAFT_191368 [Aspergillus taichungensis]
MGFHSSWMLVTLSQAFASAAEANNYTTWGTVEAGVLFSRNATIAPSALTRIVFAVQNSLLVGCLTPGSLAIPPRTASRSRLSAPQRTTAFAPKSLSRAQNVTEFIGRPGQNYESAPWVVITPPTATVNSCKVKTNSTTAASMSAALTATACLAACPK